MSKKILVILGHPSIKSLNAAIADVYVEEIQKNNSEVRYIKLRELKFNLNLKEGYNKKQKLELDLLKAQEDIK
jgi:putative NADPH-quinone reductase